MQLFLYNRKSQWLKNDIWYHYVEQDSFTKFMHTVGHWERPVPYANHSTAQLMVPQSDIYLQTQHILTSWSYWCCQTRNSTFMVIITFETILNENVGYHFCQVILLFWLWRQWLHIQNIKSRSNYVYNFQKLLQAWGWKPLL